MSFKCGIVGLPNSGKSTLFNTLTGAGARVDSFPFTTVDPNVGRVPLPDERLQKLKNMVSVEKVTPAFVEFVDIAGLVKDAHKGEGLGNAFLSHIRGVDLIVHVVRCFKADIPHVFGEPSPSRDIEIIETELRLSDIEILQRRLDRLTSLLKKGVKDKEEEKQLTESVLKYISEGKNVPEELAEKLPSDLQLISAKPVIYVANTAGEEGTERWVDEVKNIADERHAPFIVINAKLEGELLEMDEEERKEFMEIYGIQESGIEKLTRTAFRHLGLITFYTYAGGRELRAWAVPRGTTAVEGAGKIHSDFAKGFIKAEVIAFEDFVKYGGEEKVKEKGLLKIVGRDYIIQDGDIITFRVKT